MGWGGTRELSREDLMTLGYDRAKACGVLAQYLRMMNEGPSGGYSAKAIEEARRSDAAIPSAKVADEWRRSGLAQ